jgi:protein-S-isoprenylcysteine O-methyltransferase Ste14
MFRWIALVVFVTAIGTSGWLRARARRETGTIPRSAESGGMIAGRLVVALPLFLSVAVYLVRPELMDWASIGLPSSLRWAGVTLGAVVVPTVYWVLTTLGSNVSETVLTKEGHQLVPSGPPRWVRHPLQVVGIALFSSIGLMSANAFLIAWTVVALIGIRTVVVPREEAALVAKFGADYVQYRERTGALLPKLGQKGT